MRGGGGEQGALAGRTRGDCPDPRLPGLLRTPSGGRGPHEALRRGLGGCQPRGGRPLKLQGPRQKQVQGSAAEDGVTVCSRCVLGSCSKIGAIETDTPISLLLTVWRSGREREMSLKPFAYPLPETRFLHAGRHVYKFKIRYGNFNSSPNLSLTESAAKESEEVFRVILGNLDDLHPFSTDHFTVFPYLSKWERVSKMKFKHENVHLVPYPYICTLYLELNSFQRSISCGKEVKKGSDKLVRRRNEVSESTAMKEAVKRRRVEVRGDISCPQSRVDGTGAECLHQMSKAEHGFEKHLFTTTTSSWWKKLTWKY
ncbi:membrane-anchored junction protein isoform X2 [Poecile atricapillus]|uniref:membrane-anchored junction protein isoform X2 n=1 Tax=Poecile atricapillus TaxID=48891 RepID=UPI002739324A|nr:membrane-anchored junction protein isoform X2 [Poecile atricapillus]